MPCTLSPRQSRGHLLQQATVLGWAGLGCCASGQGGGGARNARSLVLRGILAALSSGRAEAVYCYEHNGRGAAFAFDGPKKLVRTHAPAPIPD